MTLAFFGMKKARGSKEGSDFSLKNSPVQALLDERN